MADEVVFDSKALRDFLDDTKAKHKDPLKATNIVGVSSAIVYKDVIQHFSDETDKGAGWKPWSAAHAARMQRLGRGGNKILQWSGRLRQNFAPTKYRTAKDAITWFNNAKTKSGYAYAWGHDSGDGKLPQREFMWMSNKAFDTITRAAADIMAGENG